MFDRNTKKNNNWWRSIIEYLVIGSIALLLYTTGYYVEVIGRLQQLALWTGIFQPDLEQPVKNPPTVAADMPLVSLTGKPTSLNKYSGKVVFINFWATWCPPCVAEMPDIQSLYENYQNNPEITFLMISLDQSPEKARKFIRRKKFSFPVFMPAGAIPDRFQSQVVPTTFVINQRGSIVLERNGMAEYDTDRFHTFLDSLIANN
ncbi:MAG TPA: TlpA disulfide reductase family protein [Balneolaceae bacterium]|nr:TlpA disulfide reductase family protein [Balneolaceae bacterium]